MAAVSAAYQNTVISPTGGANALAGSGEDYQFTLTLNQTNGKVTLILTDGLTGTQLQVGYGDATGVIPTFAKVFNDKLYFLAGANVYFSELAHPDLFNDPNGAGNGNIVLGNQVSSPENQIAIEYYQGYLAFIARRTVQIWNLDPDPSLNAKQQTLTNIGTIAKLSVQAIGDYDVFMLYDSGVRSLRPRVATNNATVEDLGTPVDALIQATLATLTDAEKAAACGTVEPTSNRYWLYIPEAGGAVGDIYVFSSFPRSQIEAWTTYSPTYQVPIDAPAANYTASQVTYTGLTIGATYAWKPGANEVQLVNGTQTFTGQNVFVATAATAVVTGTGATVAFTGALSETTTFIPEKFAIYAGQIYCRAGDNLFQYGGADNNTYDACHASARIPYLDCEMPSTSKSFTGMDVAFEGTWQVGFSGDYNTQAFKNVYNNTLSSFQSGNVPLGGRFATHFSLQFDEVSDGYARLSSAVVHFSAAEQKK